MGYAIKCIALEAIFSGVILEKNLKKGLKNAQNAQNAQRACLEDASTKPIGFQMYAGFSVADAFDQADTLQGFAQLL
jgi:hypothetical protein